MTSPITSISKIPPDTAIAMILSVERCSPDPWLVFWTGWMTLCVGAADEGTLEDEGTLVATSFVARAMGVLPEIIDDVAMEVDGEMVVLRMVSLETLDGPGPGGLVPGAVEDREVASESTAVVVLNMVDENESVMVKVLSKNEEVEGKGNRSR